LIGLNAGTVFLREVATAGGNVRTIFGEENHFKLYCVHGKKGCDKKRESNLSLLALYLVFFLLTFFFFPVELLDTVLPQTYSISGFSI
jgi:hypothetical protein